MSTRYVWSKWDKDTNVVLADPVKSFTTTTKSVTDKTSLPSSVTVEYSNKITPSGLENVSRAYLETYQADANNKLSAMAGYYYKLDGYTFKCLTNYGQVYTSCTHNTSWYHYQAGFGHSVNSTSWAQVTSCSYAKGSTSYGNVSSASSSAYPSNNYSGSYWYVYQGSDSIDPTISYPSSIFKNQNVKISVSPASNTYGGTISYKYEYTTDGSTWITANSGTTATSVDVTIPSTATTFQARVTASDNMGFTSTTAVTGANVTVYDIDPTSVTYDAEALVAGDEITVTISPTTSGYSGTITYVIQTNVDGSGWETETETTSTNVPLTIPSDAVSWTVRVYAKTSDYTSSTYVYGNGATEGVEVKHGVGFNVIPENKHLGYLGSADLMQYYVSTDDSVSYVCAITLDGEAVSSTS